MVTEYSPNNVQQAILDRRGKRFALKKTVSLALDAAKGLQVFLKGFETQCSSRSVSRSSRQINYQIKQEEYCATCNHLGRQVGLHHLSVTR